MGGYHKASIKRGTYGDISKIQEELDELVDANRQQNRIMELVELSDILGAITGYLEKHHPDYTIFDLMVMARATTDAFKSGERK